MIMFFLLLVFRVSAQNPPVLSTTSLSDPNQKFDHSKEGNYAQDTSNYRDEFVGTWQYNQNGILSQLRIFKQDQVCFKKEDNGQILDYSYSDCIILKYKLIKNGVVLFDNLNDQTYDFKKSYGTKMYGTDMSGHILDMTRNVRGFYLMRRIPSSSAKLWFNLMTTNHKMLNDSSFYQDGQPLFSIPTGGIEMVKIN